MVDTHDIERHGKRLLWLSRTLLVGSPVVAVGVLWFRGPAALLRVGTEVDRAALDGWKALPVAALGLLTPATSYLGVWLMHRLFGAFSRGVVFSLETVRLIRQAGYVLIAIDFVAMAQTALTGPVLWLLRAGPRGVTLEVHSSMLLVGLFVVLIARVMATACHLHEDGRLTI
jgi:hypothetical protein